MTPVWAPTNRSSFSLKRILLPLKRKTPQGRQAVRLSAATQRRMEERWKKGHATVMEVNHVMSDSHMEGRSIQGKYADHSVVKVQNIRGSMLRRETEDKEKLSFSEEFSKAAD